MPVVTVIPPTVQLHTAASLTGMSLRRVCGYARVSTDNEEQLTSYDAQMEYYERFIKEHDGWEFIELYSDEGISGTSIIKRKGFQKMIADAMNGKIDLIVTKSISRFARNTVDSISTVRQLKAKGVEVYFEKDGLWTFDPSAELTITILSSIAQEESRNLSQNVTWGQRARFAEGKVTMPYKRFLGYDRGEDGEPVINEEQAELVRSIYKMFVNGMTISGIAKRLTEEKVPTPGGREKWQTGVVESILTNEKYKGDALLQKTFCTDYLTKKMKLNEGEVPQYYVEGSHPAIISGELFDYVQQELKKRKLKRYSGSSSPFANRIVCSDCGRFFGSKLWHSTSQYRSTVWQCNWKFKNEPHCKTTHLKEKDIERAFVDAFNSTLENKDQILEQYEERILAITDCTELERQIREIDHDCALLETVIDTYIRQNARTVMSQEDYNSRYHELATRYDTLRNKRSDLNNEMVMKKAKSKQIKEYMQILKQQAVVLTEFDADLWRSVVDKMEVYYDRQVVFHFMDGTTVPWKV